MTWADYYDKFYDWAESTRVSRISSITDFGSSQEVCEIAQEFFESAHAGRLIKRALAGGVRFSACEIMELLWLIEEPTRTAMVESAIDTFNSEQLEELYGSVDDAVFERVSRKAKIDIFADEGEPCNHRQTAAENSGCLFALLSLFSSPASTGDTPAAHAHNGKCNGDCANCPAHYGYRYGRWYYGHHHNYGCEFGGNKGL